MANTSPSTIVGLGEILWDFLPSGKQLGGAPANFAYCSHLLGNRGVVASRIGNDELGVEVRERLKTAALSDEFLQADPAHATGIVLVKVDSQGVPQYQITEAVAWDFMEWTDAWNELARSTDAVCFGSLAQRTEQSRLAILKFVESTRPEALRVFDVNLRQKFFSAEIIRQSLQHANVVKFNEDEMNQLIELLDYTDDRNEVSFCEFLMAKFDLRLACVTHGNKGSFICDRAGVHRHGGFRVKVEDTVGSGDAFTAGLIAGTVQQKSLAEISDLANRMGAWVASCKGAMPRVPEDGLRVALSRLG